MVCLKYEYYVLSLLTQNKLGIYQKKVVGIPNLVVDVTFFKALNNKVIRELHYYGSQNIVSH